MKLNKIKAKHLFTMSFGAYFLLFLTEEWKYSIYRVSSDELHNNYVGSFVSLVSYILFVLALCYQIAFIVKLRKKDCIGFGRSIFLFFVRFFQTFGVMCITYLIHIAVFGYDVYTIALPQSAYVGTYYGFEAWAHNLFAIIIAPPLFITAVILTLIWKFTQK